MWGHIHGVCVCVCVCVCVLNLEFKALWQALDALGLKAPVLYYELTWRFMGTCK